MVSMDPEIQKLSVIYGKEAQNFDIRIAQAAPAPLRTRFLSITAKFRDVPQLRASLLTRVKNASEGMIQAIAREVERANAPMRTYGPRPAPAPPVVVRWSITGVAVYPLTLSPARASYRLSPANALARMRGNMVCAR